MIVRHLLGAPRAIQEAHWQIIVGTAVGVSDSDWAGGQVFRDSTNGGLREMGPHTTESWASTGQMVILSTVEAEFYALLSAHARP